MATRFSPPALPVESFAPPVRQAFADTTHASADATHDGQVLTRILCRLARQLDADAVHLGIDLGNGYRLGHYLRDDLPGNLNVSADAARIEVSELSIGTPRRRLRPRSHLTLLRNPQNHAFSPDERARLGILLPHLSESLGLAYELDMLRQRESSLVSAFEQIPQGFIVVAAGGEIQLANAQALDLLAQAGVRADSRLCWPTRALAQQFDTLLGQTGCNPPGLPRTLRLDGQPPVLVTLRRTSDASPTCCVQVRSITSHAILADGLAEHYRLTPAEIKLCQALAAGQTLKACAQQWQRSYLTLRSQMKAVLAKTATHRQSELLGLLEAYRLD